MAQFIGRIVGSSDWLFAHLGGHDTSAVAMPRYAGADDYLRLRVPDTDGSKVNDIPGAMDGFSEPYRWVGDTLPTVDVARWIFDTGGVSATTAYTCYPSDFLAYAMVAWNRDWTTLPIPMLPGAGDDVTVLCDGLLFAWGGDGIGVATISAKRAGDTSSIQAGMYAIHLINGELHGHRLGDLVLLDARTEVALELERVGTTLTGRIKDGLEVLYSVTLDSDVSDARSVSVRRIHELTLYNEGGGVPEPVLGFYYALEALGTTVGVEDGYQVEIGEVVLEKLGRLQMQVVAENGVSLGVSARAYNPLDGWSSWSTVSPVNGYYYVGTDSHPATKVGVVIRVPLKDSHPHKAHILERVGLYTQPASLRLLSPTGNEQVRAGDTLEITWQGTLVGGLVSLHYRREGESGWTAIAPSTPNDGVYSWVVPGLPEGTIYVRVASVIEPSVKDEGFFLLGASLSRRRTVFVERYGPLHFRFFQQYSAVYDPVLFVKTLQSSVPYRRNPLQRRWEIRSATRVKTLE